MLKGALYLNVFIIFIMSIVLAIISKNKNLKGIKIIAISYLISNIINFNLLYLDIVDIGLNIIMIFPITLVSLIIYIIVIVKVNKKLKTINEPDSNFIKTIIISIIPALIFLTPYLYELYVINNCDYLLKYNYQNGIIQSDDSYLAVINNKPVSISLLKNIFNREGRKIKVEYYNAIYNDEVSIYTRDSNWDKVYVDDEDIKKIALDARGRGKAQASPIPEDLEVKGGIIYYVREGNFAIIMLMSEESSGLGMGELFYYDGNFVKYIRTVGGLEEIICYN